METRLIHTRHPLLIDSQTNTVAEFYAGETLYAFLARNVERFGEEQLVVTVNGDVIDCAEWHNVTLKDKSIVEVRNVVKRTVLYIVAMVVLAYFTMGASLGATAATGYTAFGVAWGSAFAANLAIAGVQIAGTLLINKVLGPKVPNPGQQNAPDPVFSISSSRNQIREYQPPGLLFGTVKIAPDLISRPYTFFRGDEQYLAMILTPGFNVASVEPLYIGENLLSSYEGVSIWHSNYSDMAEQAIPLLTNVDQVAGGDLEAGVWVVRTTSPNTISIGVDFEYVLFDKTNKGRDKNNSEVLAAEYRLAGSSGAWASLFTRPVVNKTSETRRLNVTVPVAQGQYEVRVRRAGNASEINNGFASFRYVVMSSIQPDQATYQGFPRTGLEIQATGQLNGAPDTIRTIAHSKPIEVWNGTEWVLEETSNPGAHALRYIRGIYDEEGALVAGIGLSDSLIDIESFKAFMLHCADMGFKYDHWITDTRNHWEVLQPIMLAGMGKIAWPNGRIAALWVAEDQPSDGVVNMATIKRGSFQIDYTLARAADGIEATYYDSSDWSAKTIRVPAPGVTTMLDPARLTLEGVVDEEHAAFITRYHLAQSIYQYKDIVYATDVEALSYRNMSMLDLQHDLTQWGYGGRVMAAENNGGVVTVMLDEPVPPLQGTAYLGLRIPGEKLCRVFPVVDFEEETDTLTLVGTWPNDAAFPGEGEGNPAHDTVWMYDFSASPGARVRVVGMELEPDLKGANVAVVQEGEEFWHYVRTGEYIPPAGESLLDTAPKVTNLQISEIQVVQGDTVYTELQATFDIDGYALHSVVLMAGADQILNQVAQTSTRSAQWRIPGPGTYLVVVRPVGEAGRIGKPASAFYTTIGADAAPILHDFFNVLDMDGGIRKYEFGFLPDSNRSPDMAGAEIRFITGTETSPDWEAMEPLGSGDGFFTSTFEAATPVAGIYTFALRTRNTSGRLSTEARVVNITLSSNVGEIINDIETGVNENTQQIIDLFEENAQLAQDLAAGFAQEAVDRAAAIQAATDDLQAEIDTIQAQLTDIVSAPDWDAVTTYNVGDLVKHEGFMYRSKTTNTNQEPPNATHWENLGQYESLGELVAAHSVAISELETDVSNIDGVVTAHTGQITALDSRIDDTEADIQANTTAIGTLQTTTTAQGNTITTQGTAITSLTSRITAAENVNTSQATALSGLTTRVTDAEGDIGSIASQITALNTTVANKADSSALSALTAEVTSIGNQVTSQAGQITVLSSALNDSSDNLIRKSRFEDNAIGLWNNAGGGAAPTVVAVSSHPERTRALRVTRNAREGGAGTASLIASKPGEVFDVSADVNTQTLNSSSTAVFRLYFYNKAGDQVSAPVVFQRAGGALGFVSLANTVVAPAGTAWVAPTITLTGTEDTTASFWTDIVVRRRSAVEIASAGAISTLDTAVTNINGQLSAQSTQITNLTTSLESKAEASAVSALQATVTAQGNTLTGQATQITSLNTSVGNVNANITTLNQVTASAISGNAIPNASFEDGPALWSFNAGAAHGSGVQSRSGNNHLRLNGGATAPLATSAHQFTVKGGQKLRLSFWHKLVTAPTNGYARLNIRYYDTTGASISYAATNCTVNYTASSGTYAQAKGVETVPLDAVTARIYVASNSTNGIWAIDDISVEPLTDLEENALAKVGLYLDVNGNISGYETVNDGVTSLFKILADKFQIVSPAGGERTEFSGGNWRVYDTANVLRVRLGVW